jgi:hypothetical protein
MGVGAGVDLPDGFGVIARFVVGFTNVADDLKDPGGEAVGFYNNVLQISGSYKLFGK